MIRFLADPKLWLLMACALVIYFCVSTFAVALLWPSAPSTYQEREAELRLAMSAQYAENAPRGHVYISVQSLDSVSGKARCQFYVSFQFNGNEAVSTADGASVFVAPNRESGALRESFEGMSIELELSDTTAGWFEAITLPLRGDGYGWYSHTFMRDIPALMKPTRFPQDDWSFSVNGFLKLPVGDRIALRNPDAPDVQWDWGLPLVVTFIQSPQLEQWELSATSSISDVLPTHRPQPGELPGVGQSIGASTVTAVMKRPADVWLFVYAVAALPLILGAGYLISQRSSRDSAAAMSLAAALLSLLTLRQVVTPVDIQGITRLDRLLSLELAVLIAAFTVTTVLPSRKGTRAPAGAPATVDEDPA